MKLQTRPDGLKFDSNAGVLLAPPSRFVPDPDQPRTHFPQEDLKRLHDDIAAWRDAGRGLAGTGIMDPFLCRWESGAIKSNGEVKKTAKIIIMDGERRWRATRERWKLLPLVLDDMSSEEAHDAALRTSIHKQQLLPIEEAHAFQRKKQLSGWGTHKLARHYNISEGYVRNRIFILDCTKDVQAMVEKHTDTLSHALAFRAAGKKLPAHDRKELIKAVIQGMSLVDLKEEIAGRIEAAERESQSRRAPDTHTQRRQIIAKQQGSAPVSRGRLVQADTAREAKAEIEDAIDTITGKLVALESFAGSVDKKYFSEKVLLRLVPWQQAINRLKSKYGDNTS